MDRWELYNFSNSCHRKYVIVVTGYIVTKDVPDKSMISGVPAKVIKKLEDDVNE